LEEREMSDDIAKAFETLKKMGVTIPMLSTQDQLAKLPEFTSRSFLDTVDFIRGSKEPNKEFLNSIQESIRRTWNIP
jgi:hypothetical protein